MAMDILFDAAKEKINIEKHGFSLSAYRAMELDQAIIRQDRRKEYGEERLNVFAPMDGRLCIATITKRKGAIRVISFRKCNKREVRRYEKEKRYH